MLFNKITPCSKVQFVGMVYFCITLKKTKLFCYTIFVVKDLIYLFQTFLHENSLLGGSQ